MIADNQFVSMGHRMRGHLTSERHQVTHNRNTENNDVDSDYLSREYNQAVCYTELKRGYYNYSAELG